MIENKNVISSFCFVSMLFLGVGSTLIGAAARNIGLTPFQIGLILSIQNFGFMLGVTVSGALADTYEKPKILFVGSIILAASFLTFYVTDSFFLNLVIMFFIGVGIGTHFPNIAFGFRIIGVFLTDAHEARDLTQQLVVSATRRDAGSDLRCRGLEHGRGLFG